MQAKRFLKLFLLLIPVLLFAGCSSTGTKTEGDGAPVSDAGGDGSGTIAASEGAAWSGNPLEDPDSPLYTKVIYFEYDSVEIQPEYRDVIRAHAQHLVANPTASARVEGHADERGSREYNIALGQRRSDAVVRLMVTEGVAEEQLIPVSYGEEQLAAYGQDEASHRLNRRVELSYRAE